MERTRVAAAAIPSLAVVTVFALIIAAAVAFFVTGRPDQDRRRVLPVAAATTAPSPAAIAATAKPKREVPRAYVEIFNNSGISGLGDTTSSRVQGAGWKVVGVDNWYGNVPDTTVYYPRRLRGQAERLARDLGIARVKPAVAPMRLDRITVILTRQP